MLGLEDDAMSSFSDPTQNAVLLHVFRTSPDCNMSQCAKILFLSRNPSFNRTQRSHTVRNWFISTSISSILSQRDLLF